MLLQWHSIVRFIRGMEVQLNMVDSSAYQSTIWLLVRPYSCWFGTKYEDKRSMTEQNSIVGPKM